MTTVTASTLAACLGSSCLSTFPWSIIIIKIEKFLWSKNVDIQWKSIHRDKIDVHHHHRCRTNALKTYEKKRRRINNRTNRDT